MQEIFSAPRKPMKIYDPVNLDSYLEYRRVVTTENLQPYSRTKIDFEPENDFTTIFSATFSVESTKIVDKQIWMIQDQTAFDESEFINSIKGKTSPKRLLAEAKASDKLSATPSRDAFMMILELVSFIGAIWFVLTQLVFGPLSSMMLKDQKPQDIVHLSSGVSGTELELQRQSSSN